MTLPAPAEAETCVLCGTALAADAERCPACDLWVGVDRPGRPSRVPRTAIWWMVGGIAIVWAVTFGVAAVVG